MSWKKLEAGSKLGRSEPPARELEIELAGQLENFSKYVKSWKLENV